ncbi:MAG: hypothetical protein JW808_05840 [Victivallales bacterium]|nr:hypothetical protein [Victivallales bacterium]
MQIVGALMMLAGGVGAIFFGILLIVRAFETSLVWGLVYLFVPFGAFIFIITNWGKTWKPLAFQILSLLSVFAGAAMGGFLTR